MGLKEVEAFLNYLTTKPHVSASTQSQAPLTARLIGQCAGQSGIADVGGFDGQHIRIVKT